MPLVPSTMQKQIQLKASSSMMAGSKLSDFVSAISKATCQYIIASAIVNSTNTVLGPGAGTQTGTVIGLVPQQMSKMMQLKGASSGIAGKDFGKLCDAISFGVCTSVMTSVTLQGTVVGGGPGTGIGKITGLVPSSLSALILSQEAFRMIAGSKLKETILAIASGICTHIMSMGTVNVINIGFFTPPVGPILLPGIPGFGKLI